MKCSFPFLVFDDLLSAIKVGAAYILPFNRVYISYPY